MIETIGACLEMNRGVQHQIVVLCNLMFAVSGQEALSEVGQALTQHIFTYKQAQKVSYILD